MAINIFRIDSNRFLKYPNDGYYSIDFYGYRQTGVLTFLHRLKNRYGNEAESMLNKCKDEAKDYIVEFLSTILKKDSNDDKIIVCRIPRSKADFKENRLYFQKAVREAITIANQHLNNRLVDGIDYIKRIESVATTHLASVIVQDKMPYPNITKDTCEISDKIANETIILIDDIYTIGVNVVEDCIQALYDKGAKRVIFYAVGRTVKYGNTQSKLYDVRLNPLDRDNAILKEMTNMAAFRKTANSFYVKCKLIYPNKEFEFIYLKDRDELLRFLDFTNGAVGKYAYNNGEGRRISSPEDLKNGDFITITLEEKTK